MHNADLQKHGENHLPVSQEIFQKLIKLNNGQEMIEKKKKK